MEQRIAQLERNLDLVIQAMTAIKNKVLALEGQGHQPEVKLDKKPRQKTTLETYMKVKALAAQGLDYKQIGEQLDVSPSTVKGSYLENSEKWEAMLADEVPF